MSLFRRDPDVGSVASVVVNFRVTPEESEAMAELVGRLGLRGRSALARYALARLLEQVVSGDRPTVPVDKKRVRGRKD